MFELDAFLIGVVIGITSSICGALIDYLRLCRLDDPEQSGAPGCIYLVSGGLGFLGLVVIIISFIIQSVGRAITAGIGVLFGFIISFLLLMVLWFFLQRNNR